jgi:hypothetical protein
LHDDQVFGVHGAWEGSRGVRPPGDTRCLQGCGALRDAQFLRRSRAKIIELASDPVLRQRLGEAGVERIDSELAWEIGEDALLGAYADLLRRDGARGSGEHVETAPVESHRDREPAGGR